MKNVHYMTRIELENELIERRLQVENLICEIQRKDEYLRMYNNYFDKLMKKERIKKKTKGIDKGR